MTQFLVMQVASTSRGSSAPSGSRGGGIVGHARTTHVPTAVESRNTSIHRAEERRATADGAPQVFAIREGEPLPEGYSLLVRAPATPTAAPKAPETVDLSTPPDAATGTAIEDVNTSKRKAAERRNLTRKSNREAHASYAKEVKESLAEGRPPTMNVSEDQTHLKSRWHAVAKEAAYKILDLRKENWRSYTVFEKGKVHREVGEKCKFGPPLDPRKIDKYLAGHLRSARAVWKSHWLQHGSEARHPNCPEEAWETLIHWWATEECKDEAAAMADRRSKVQNRSRTGRKPLVDRMDEQVK